MTGMDLETERTRTKTESFLWRNMCSIGPKNKSLSAKTAWIGSGILPGVFFALPFVISGIDRYLWSDILRTGVWNSALAMGTSIVIAILTSMLLGCLLDAIVLRFLPGDKHDGFIGPMQWRLMGSWICIILCVIVYVVVFILWAMGSRNYSHLKRCWMAIPALTGVSCLWLWSRGMAYWGQSKLAWKWVMFVIGLSMLCMTAIAFSSVWIYEYIRTAGYWHQW